MRPVPVLLGALLAALPVTTGGTGHDQLVPEGTTWSWPLTPQPRVASRFVAPPGPYAPGHRGVDLAARIGQGVHAAGAGTVAFAGQVAGRGVVVVAHPGGLRTTYEPVTAARPAGAPVRRGTVLGTVTAAPGHCLPATCLHWGLRRGGSYLDPLVLLGLNTAVRLLPVWGLRAAQAGRLPAGRSRRGRCRPGRRAGRSRGPPRW